MGTKLDPAWEAAISESRIDRERAEHLAARYGTEICDTCGKLIIPLEDACYGAADPGPRHYECQKSLWPEGKSPHEQRVEGEKKLKESLDKLGELIDELRGKSGTSQADKDFDGIQRRRNRYEGPRSGPVDR